ncbi:Protein BCCIP-like protein, partial [Mucuna pruriens]
MSEVWHLLKKSLPCKPQSSEVHDPKASRSTQRKKQVKIETQEEKHVSHEIFVDRSSGEIKICQCYPCSHQGNEDGKGVQEPYPLTSTKRVISSSKSHCVDCDECYVFSKKKVPRQKDSNVPPTSIPHHQFKERLKSIDTVEEEHDDIPEHSVIQLEREGSSYKIIKQICQDSYIDCEGKVAHIGCVLRVQNKQVTFAYFEECREMVRVKSERLQNEHPRCLVDGNELLRFHGTTIACSLGLNASCTLCTLDQCGVCQILRHGFEANQEFHGVLGVYTTCTSGKAIDSISSSNNNSVPRKSVMVCRVLAGRIHHNPPLEIKEMIDHGFDSLVKKMSDQSQIEELIVLNPRAVLPCFLKSNTKTLGRPKRHRQRLKSWPITFSPFARALALSRMPSLSTPKRLSHNPTPKEPELSDSSDEDFDGVVQADFSFFDPKSDDFHGAKTLLQPYLDNQEWDLSGFVDLILGQTTVGTLVKIEDDEDEGIFALVTALNLYRYREHTCIVSIKDFLLHKARREKGVADHLRLLLGEQARDVGLLVSQRMVNLPPQLLPPLYDALFDEVSWATEDEPTEELRNSFKFKHYIILTKIYVKNVEQKRKPSNDSDEVTIYIKLEDEIFHKIILQKNIKLEVLGNVKYFFGLDIVNSVKGICLLQKKYTLQLLEDSGFLASKPLSLIMDPNNKLNSSDGKPLPNV